MGTIHLPSDFNEFLRLLDVNGVEYLVVGGMAVAFHGYPRSTGDLDIWVRRSRENAEALVRVIEQFGFGDHDLKPELFEVPGQLLRMGNPPLRIEVLTSISGVEFETCTTNAVVATINDTAIRFIGLRDLRLNKAAAGRLKDLLDLENLP